MRYYFLLLVPLIFSTAAFSQPPNRLIREVHQEWNQGFENNYELRFEYEGDSVSEERFSLWNKDLGRYEPHSRTLFEYDNAQRLIHKEQQYWRNGSWMPGNRSFYEYDSAGNETLATNYLFRQEVERYAIYSQTQTQYDALGRPIYRVFLLQEHLALPEPTPNSQVFISYSADGKTIWEVVEIRDGFVPLTWRTRSTFTRTLDEQGRTVLIQEVDPVHQTEQRTTYSFNPTGELISCITDSRPDSTQGWSYKYGSQIRYEYTVEGWISERHSISDGLIFDETYIEDYQNSTRYLHTCEGLIWEYHVSDNRSGVMQPVKRVLREYERESPCAVQDHSLYIYPNPVRDRIFLQHPLLELPHTQLQIFASNGQQVFEKRELPTGSLVRLDIRSLTPGIYLLCIVQGDQRITRKIQVN